MKYIFDFDDVLFQTGRRRYEHMYPRLKKAGISTHDIDEYYQKVRGELFSMKKLLAHFSLKEDYYEEMMREIETFNNEELLKEIKKLGKSNCYIISYGDTEFQLDKIKRTGVASLFSEIIVVQESKKKMVEKICTKHKDEKVFFIDDKAENFKDLDFKKSPNLKTILYTGQNLESYLQ